MLKITATVEQMLIYVDKQLDFADMYLSDEYKHLPKHIIKEQVDGFRNQAFGVIYFIYSTLGENNNHINYRGIKIPEHWLEYFQIIKKNKNNNNLNSE